MRTMINRELQAQTLPREITYLGWRYGSLLCAARNCCRNLAGMHLHNERHLLPPVSQLVQKPRSDAKLTFKDYQLRVISQSLLADSQGAWC